MVLDDKMTVMQVRSNYSIVYQFKPTLRLEKKQVKTQQDFVKYLKELTNNWKDGDYFFKTTQGTFAYFNINGNKISLVKWKEAKIVDGSRIYATDAKNPAHIDNILLPISNIKTEVKITNKIWLKTAHK